MEIKKLEKPRRLQIYECLKGRRELNSEEQYELYKLEFGHYEGESPFNKLAVKHLHPDLLIISDLVVNDGQWYQIDCIIIKDRKLYLNEIKYLKGPLMYKDGDLYVNGEKMKDDYLRKFKRVKGLLEYALEKNGFYIEVIPHLIFMNPAMMFYGNTPELPVLMYHQVEPFLKSIKPQPSHYSRQVANFLLSLHSEENPFEKRKINTDITLLRQGIRCAECGSLNLFFGHRKSHCQMCKFAEYKADGIIRNVKEFQILYPLEKITPIKIYRWCGEKISLKTVQKIVNKEVARSF